MSRRHDILPRLDADDAGSTRMEPRTTVADTRIDVVGRLALPEDRVRGIQRLIAAASTVDELLRLRWKLADLGEQLRNLEAYTLERADAICRERD